MRFKLFIITVIFASLACTVNVSVLNTPVPASEPVATAGVEATSPVSVPPLEGLPVVVPGDISSIRMIDTQNGWMITDHFVLRTMNGGATWHDVSPRDVSPFGFGTGNSFFDADRGWILIGAQSDPVNTGTLYRTTDGGLQWSEYSVPFGSGDLHFLDEENGWFMLNVGAVAGSMAVKFYQTIDGGAHWTQVYSNVPTETDAGDSLPVSGIKTGFTPVSMQEAWVTGQTSAPNTIYLYHTTDGGHTWSIVDPGLSFGGESQYLTQPPVFFGSQIGLLPTMAGSEGAGTFFFITQDGGNSWTPSAGVPGSGFTSIVSPNDIFIFFSGTLFVTRDAGQTWTTVTPNIDLNSNSVRGFQFVDTQTGWIVLGDASAHTSLYKTTDGGQTWVAQIP